MAMSTQTKLDLLASLKDLKIKRFIGSTPAPANEHEKLILILKGYEKSLVGDYWVLYSLPQ